MLGRDTQALSSETNTITYHYPTDSIDKLVESFAHSDVEELNIITDSEMPLTPAVAIKLFDGLPKHTHSKLRKINLSHCVMSDESALALAKWMNQGKTLEHLDLSFCDLSSTATSLIIDAIPSSLRVLNLAHNQIGQKTGASETVNSIADMLACNETLMSLDLSANDINDDQGRMLFEALMYNAGTLTELNVSSHVSGVSLGVETAAAIGKLFNGKTALKKLDLSYHPKLGAAIDLVMEGLEKNISLTELNLNHCQLNEVAYIDIRKLLRKNTTLQVYCEPNLECEKDIKEKFEEVDFLLKWNRKEAVPYSASKDPLTHTPLMLAAFYNNLAKVKQEVTPATIQAESLVGSTPIMFAAQGASLDMVQYLVACGADIYHRNKGGFNAFLYAVAANKLNIVKWLITEMKFEPSVDDVNTAYLLAARDYHYTMLHFIHQHFHTMIGDNEAIMKMADNPYCKIRQIEMWDLKRKRKDIHAIVLLQENREIEKLNFSHDCNEQVALIMSYIAHNTTLKSVNVRFDNEAQLEQLLHFFKNNPNLEEVSFGFYNSLKPECARKIFHALASNPNLKLKKLNLHSNKIGAEGGYALAELVRKCHSLEELNLEHCELGPDVSAAVIRAANHEHGRLQSLNLTYNQIGPCGSKALAEYLTKTTTLTTLSICANHNLQEGIITICEALEKNKSVKTLDVSCLYPNKTEYVAALAKMIANNNAIETMNLGANNFDDQDGVLIVTGLQVNSSIRHLLLRNTGSGNAPSFAIETAAALKTMLQQNTTLEYLDFWYHSKLGEGALFLAMGLKDNHTLKELYINDIHIKDEALAMLLLAIRKSKTITSLDIGSTGAGEQSAREIARILRDNKTPLQYLNLAGGFSTKEYIQIFDAIRANKTLERLYLGFDNYYTSATKEASLYLLETIKYYNTTLQAVSGFRLKDDAEKEMESLLDRNKKWQANELTIEEMASITQQMEEGKAQVPVSIVNQPGALFYHASPNGAAEVRSVPTAAMPDSIEKEEKSGLRNN